MKILGAPGKTKLANGVVSGMAALGNTKAPVEISSSSGFVGEEGLLARTTFAKCVGTEIFGGLPITSCVWSEKRMSATVN